MKKLLLIALSLLLTVSLVGCAKKTSPVECSVVVAKHSDELDAGTALSAEDAASLMSQITAAGSENQWIDAVSNSIPSCYLSIESAGEATLYQYSYSGVLDDLTHMRSLTLTSVQNDSINELLSKYVDLQLPLASIPFTVDDVIEPLDSDK